jgi:hypothetical protein
VYTSNGTPIRIAYQRAELDAALATEFETIPARPMVFAAVSGELDAASE